MVTLNNKKFILVENSLHGKASNKTILHFSQSDNRIAGYYSDAVISTGHIIGKLLDEDITLTYHCFAENDQIMVGEATGKVNQTDDDKLELVLNWRWLLPSNNSGQSRYVEI